MLIEGCAQVFASTIEGFYGLTVPLCYGLGLITFVDIQCLIFAFEQEGSGVSCCIISEYNEVFLALAQVGGGWAPYIDMYLIAKTLC